MIHVAFQLNNCMAICFGCLDVYMLFNTKLFVLELTIYVIWCVSVCAYLGVCLGVCLTTRKISKTVITRIYTMENLRWQYV